MTKAIKNVKNASKAKTVRNSKNGEDVKMKDVKNVKDAKIEEAVEEVKVDEVAADKAAAPAEPVKEEKAVEPAKETKVEKTAEPVVEETAKKETVTIIKDADKAVEAVEQMAEETVEAVEQLAEETVDAIESETLPLPEVSIKDADAIVSTILETLENDEYNNSLKVVNIMQYLQTNVDMTEVPPALAPDYELTRRIRILQSKKTAASKNYNFEEVMKLEQQIAYLNSCKKSTSNRPTTQKPEEIDHSKLTQEELRKKIRNYQSRKSTCKKAADAAKASGNEQGYADNMALVDYWQSMVVKAQSYIQGSATRAQEVENKATALLKTLKAMPATPEIEAAIAQLEATLK